MEPNQYYYRFNRADHGPVSEQLLRDLVTKGTIPRTTLIRKADANIWIALDLELKLPPSAPGANAGGVVSSLSQRYKDAYTEAHAVVAVGKFIKGVEAFLFIAAILGGCTMASERSSGGVAAVVGVVVACLVGIPIYVLGILVAAQGQTQLATLDTAINSSRHLSDDQVADILSKRFCL